MEIIKLLTERNSIGVRIDTYLSANKELNLSRSRIKKLTESGNVLLNGNPVKGSKGLNFGDLIEIRLEEEEVLDVTPKDIPLEIIYQDQDLAVINKPQGMVVHAGNGTNGDTLVNALMYHLDNLSGINGVIRPGIVHRIDKNTSGLLVVAKNDEAHVSLAKQIENKTCKRVYVALLQGNLKIDSGTIRTFIGRDKNDRTKMAVVDYGRDAVTDYKVVKRYDGFTLCRFSLKTGRTHQIRVHAKHIGHPVVGDPEYGYKNQKFKLNGQLLHAEKLEFIHPRTNEKMTFTCEKPDYFNNILKKLKEI